MIAKTAKEVIKAMIWLYENRLDHVKETLYIGKNNKEINFFKATLGYVNGGWKLSPIMAECKSACIVGCLWLIDTSDHVRNDTRQLLQKTIKDRRASDMDLIYWNEQPERSKADVINLLKDAIDE